MPEKMTVKFDRETAFTAPEETIKKREKLRRKFENKSYWPLIKKGPLGTGVYGMFMFPKVCYDHMILNDPEYPLTIYQETLLRTMKWSMNSTIKTLRKSGSFVELLVKTFRCSEKFQPLKADVKAQLGGIEGYWLGPIKYKQKESEATILYLHGGGYVALSSVIGISSLCYLLKKLRKRYRKHVRVLAIDYSLAPENPFPTGLNCAESAYRWLVKSGIPGSRNVFLCGDSAGGGLSLALLQKLYPDESTGDAIPLPLGSILISPWVELSCDSLSYFTNAKYDWICSHYAQFAAEYYIFGEDGNPSRKRDASLKQNKFSKEIVVMDWLEKVEATFDLIDAKRVSLEVNKRLSNEINKRLSNEIYKRLSNQSSNKRCSIKSGKKSAKRRSHIHSNAIDPNEITVQIHEPDETFRKNRECWVSSALYKLRSSRIIEENPYSNPLISPLHIPHHTLAKFPPLLISYGGKEVFRDDIEMFIQKCIESKKVYASFDDKNVVGDSLDGQHPDIIVEMNEEMVHDYPMFKEVFGKHSKKSLDRIVHFIANRIPFPKPKRNSKSSKTSSSKKPQESITRLSSPIQSDSRFSVSVANTDGESIPNSRKIYSTFISS